jgi:hypothetical protein
MASVSKVSGTSTVRASSSRETTVIFERNLGIVTNERGVIAVSYDLGCGLTAEQFGAREELGTPIAKH